ncbi:MAG: prephenate dehydratase domain-containing protein [Thermodesulfobacteriota bacterium]
MTTIAIIGPKGSNTWLAAHAYAPKATIKSYANHEAMEEAFTSGATELMILPVYNTRIGGVLRSFRTMTRLPDNHWRDNIIQDIHLSLGSLDDRTPLKVMMGTSQVMRQSEEYLLHHFPEVALLTVPDLEEALSQVKSEGLKDHGIIEAEGLLTAHGLHLREREVAPHNKTRYAVIGHEPTPASGYDATALVSKPLKDRVGMLFDTLGAFTKRGINILDMRAETDVRSQELQIFIEAEGHRDDPVIKETICSLEQEVIQEDDVIQVLGSFPRVDMRVKRIKSFGFIGTGAMSGWFAQKLEHEGYKTVLTGRSTKLSPAAMIPEVDVVCVCVPISHTAATVAQYGPLLKDGQAMILLAGEAENTLDTALEVTKPGVEVMLVHNLWGPAAATMKDKNASVVRTQRSGRLCSEFESFLYKHGAAIYHDSPQKHDLLMGVGQKLPTTISVALALALADNEIEMTDIPCHATLTSLYSILAMARVHNQNARTYAEIMATKGEGRKIVRSFAENLLKVTDMAEAGEIGELCDIIDQSRSFLTPDFLASSMKQSLAVDETLGKMMK